LPAKNNVTDAIQFAQICEQYFSFKPAIRSTHRFGSSIEGKVQLLLISLTSTKDVEHILTYAKVLRTSSDPVIRDQVFVNKHLTRAEARAAFEARSIRRNKKKQEPRINSNSNGSSNNSSTMIETVVEMNLIDLASTQPPAQPPISPPGIHPNASSEPLIPSTSGAGVSSVDA